MPNRKPEYKLESPFTENFDPHWKMWKAYRKEEHRFEYKSSISEQAALNMLVDLSEGDEEHAVRIMMQSMSRGWMGFFKIHNPKKDKKDGDATNKQPGNGTGAKTISIEKGKAAHAKRYGDGQSESDSSKVG